MITMRVSLRPPVRNSFLMLFASLLASCSPGPFNGSIKCQDFDSIPITPSSSQVSHTVFETPGTIIAIHGSGHARLHNGKSAPAIKVEQSVTLPAYADRATVFLNGWRLSYLGGDQHVLVLGSLITKIRTTLDDTTGEKKLVWNALALLRDDDGEEGYNWNYDFTVLAWNAGSVAADVDQGNANNQFCAPDGTILDNLYHGINVGTSSALSSFFSFIKDTFFETDKAVAALPRGFAFWWGGDHHLLQMAYNLDHSEIFVDTRKYSIRDGSINAVPPGASVAASGFVSWNTNIIFKDNDTRRDYAFGEVVSAMGGSDVGVIQPPFSILPSESAWFCGTQDSPPVRTEEFVIENVPFEYAIPMLTGWDLEYLCNDQHVKEIGIWIDNWSYQPPAGGAGGILRYTLGSVLRDDDNNPDYGHSHKVTVLGLRPMLGSTRTGG